MGNKTVARKSLWKIIVMEHVKTHKQSISALQLRQLTMLPNPTIPFERTKLPALCPPVHDEFLREKLLEPPTGHLSKLMVKAGRFRALRILQDIFGEQLHTEVKVILDQLLSPLILSHLTLALRIPVRNDASTQQELANSFFRHVSALDLDDAARFWISDIFNPEVFPRLRKALRQAKSNKQPAHLTMFDFSLLSAQSEIRLATDRLECGVGAAEEDEVLDELHGRLECAEAGQREAAAMWTEARRRAPPVGHGRVGGAVDASRADKGKNKPAPPSSPRSLPTAPPSPTPASSAPPRLTLTLPAILALQNVFSEVSQKSHEHVNDVTLREWVEATRKLQRSLGR
ncbi:hypothetical protein JCM10207_008837 [Rhodosporidiobolus poonsookiae]